MSISLSFGLSPAKRAETQKTTSGDGDPCVSSEGKEKRKNGNSEVSERVLGKEGHGRGPRLPLDCLVNKLV